MAPHEKALRGPDSRNDESSAPCIAELRTFQERPHESMGIRPLILHCVETMCAGVPPLQKMDERVTKVLQEIRASNDLRISLESAAASVYLSEGRFAHLFKHARKVVEVVGDSMHGGASSSRSSRRSERTRR